MENQARHLLSSSLRPSPGHSSSQRILETMDSVGRDSTSS
jgi:hypothetical protein